MGGVEHPNMGDRNKLRRTRITVKEVEDDETLQEEDDRISDLHDSLLLEILSLLRIREIIRTGTLSKRWQHLWTFVPNFVFTPRVVERISADEIVSTINRTLIQSRASKIGKLYIHIPYKPSYNSDVDLWIRFATRKNVEDLSLSLCHFDSDDAYSLPQHVYTNSSLKSLGFESCTVTPSGQISWSSLKCLSIIDVDLGNHVIERILSGCPVLEILKLEIYWYSNRLKVSSQTLKEFVLSDCQTPYDETENGLLEISAPHLRLLRFDGGLYTRHVHLLDVSALDTVDLSFEMHIDPVHPDTSHVVESYCNLVQELLSKLGHVRELTVATWFIQVLSLLELKGLPSPLLKCKSLTLDMHIGRGDLPGIVKLLEISPCLETLVITTNTYCPAQFLSGDILEAYIGDNYFSAQKRIPKCLPLHLKKIKYFGFRKMFFEVELVNFLMKNASVLGRMFIYPVKDGPVCGGKCCCTCTSQDILLEDFMNFPISAPHLMFSVIPRKFLPGQYKSGPRLLSLCSQR